MSDFFYSDEDCQEFFSEAYIAAISAVAGFSFEYKKVDRNSIDVFITQRIDGNNCPQIEELKIQLKCTYAHTPQNGVLTYPLKIKNYNDLRQESLLIPRILVVVYTPNLPRINWLQHNNNHLILKYEAFWVSLRGRGSVTNTTTININLKQKFTVSSLQALMDSIANGNYP